MGWVLLWKQLTAKVHKKLVSAAERGPCNHPLLETSEFRADVSLLLGNFINKLKRAGKEVRWLQLRCVWQRGKQNSASYAAGEWRPFLKVEAKEEGCLSLQREHAAAGLAPLCTDDDPWGCYSCLLKKVLSFLSFFPLFQSEGFVAISLLSSSEAFGHAQPGGESCVLQDVSLQLPYVLHTDVSSVLSCSVSSCLKNMV